MPLRRVADEGEAEAAPADRVVERRAAAVEAVEDPPLLLGGNARPAVRHLDAGRAVAVPREPERRLSPAVLRRVVEEVRHRLSEKIRIAGQTNGRTLLEDDRQSGIFGRGLVDLDGVDLASLSSLQTTRLSTTAEVS